MLSKPFGIPRGDGRRVPVPEIGDSMSQDESVDNASAEHGEGSRLPVAYIYCRTWLDFKGTFPFDDFNALPDREIEDAIRAFGRKWLKDNEKSVAKLVAKCKRDIDEKLAKRQRAFIHGVHDPVGASAKAKMKAKRAKAQYERRTTMPSPDDFATIAGLAGWARLSDFPGELSPSPRMYIAIVPSPNGESAVAALNSAEWPGMAADALGDGGFAEGSAMLRPRFGSLTETDLSEPERAIAKSAIAALARKPSDRDRTEFRLRHYVARGAAAILEPLQTVPATLDQIKQAIRGTLADRPAIAERVAQDPTAHCAARWWPRGGGVPVSALPDMVEARLSKRSLRSDAFDIDTATGELLKNGEIERIESGPETAYLHSGAERRGPVLRMNLANKADEQHPALDSPAAEECGADHIFGIGYRSVRWYGTDFNFTVAQAGAVELLATAFERGVPDVPDETLLEKAGVSETSRLCDTFKANPAWGTMIVRGKTKGAHRLARPEKP